MSCLKAYVIAVFEVARMLGFIFLLRFLFQGDALALFLVYLSLVAGTAGPIALLINGGVDAK